MKRMQILLGAAVLGFTAVSATNATADLAPERKSTLTVVDRVEVPGAILEPGTYVVKLGDLQNNRNVVIFSNADETKVITTAIATPHEALNSTPNTTFTYYNSPAGTPRVLRTWFAPNDRFGQDLVYPKERAVELSKLTDEKVPEVSTDMSRSTDREKTPQQPIESKTTALAPAPPAPAMAERMTSEPSPRTPDAMTAENSPRELPKTASYYPALFALGLVALSAAAALRLSGKSS